MLPFRFYDHHYFYELQVLPEWVFDFFHILDNLSD